MNEFIYTTSNNEVKLFKYRGKSKNVIIPETIENKKVTAILDFCFYGNEEIESVILPNTIKEIGDDAFGHCSNLKSIKLNEDLVELGYSCFSNCTSLEEIVIPHKIDILYCSTFYNCESLRKIEFKGKLGVINNYCFENCYSLNDVIINGNNLTIYDFAFSSCTSLEKIVISGLSKIKSCVFMGCDSLKIAVLKFNDFYSVCDDAFEECNELETIYFKEEGAEISYESSIDNSGFKPCKMVNLGERDWCIIE